jgi:hypothetical protein
MDGFIHYCEKCGLRVPEKDLASGAARALEDHRALCAACQGASQKPAGKTGAQRVTRESLRGVPAAAPAPSPAPAPASSRITGRPHAHPAAPPAADRSTKVYVLAGSVLAGVVLGAVVLVFFSGSKPEPLRKTDVADKRFGTAKENPPAPKGDTAGSGATPEPKEKVETDPMADARNKVAAEELARIRKYHQENPADTDGFHYQLWKMVDTYRGTAAGQEAARWWESLKVPEDFLAVANWNQGWQASAENPRTRFHEEFDGQHFVFETHPPSEQEPLRLTRKTKVSEDKPFLECVVRGHDAGDCEVWVEANGQKPPAVSVGGRIWRRFAVDLTAFKGQEVELALVHKATGWASEYAYWQMPRFVEKPSGGSQTLAFAAPVAPVTKDEEAEEAKADWKKAVNLLALVKPADDAVFGTWKLQPDGSLTCDRAPHARLALPYQPPAEYDFRITFTVQENLEAVIQLISQGSRPFEAILGGWKNTASGFHLVNGRGGENNPTTQKKDRVLETGRRYTMVTQVRKNGLKLFLDGQLVSQHRTDYQDMSGDPLWNLGAGKEQWLGLGAFDIRAVFHSAEVAELTGKGRIQRLAGGALTTALPGTAKGAQARWLGELQGFLRSERFDKAQQRLQELKGDAARGDLKTALEQDAALLRLAEQLDKAALEGFALLKDGRAFMLQKSDGKPLPVGKSAANRVVDVKDGLVELELGMGGGKLAQRVNLDQFSLKARVDAAWLALPDDAAGRLKHAMGAVLRYREGAAEPAPEEIRKLLDTVAQDAGSGPAVTRLRAWLEQAEREQAAKAAFDRIKSLSTARMVEELKKSIEALKKEHAETAFYAEVQPQLGELETQSAVQEFRPGLWAMYFSGDKGGKFKRSHTAQVETKLSFDWGGNSPAQGVPRDFWGLRFRGLLRIEKEGQYEFYVRADDEAEFYLDGQKLCAFYNNKEAKFGARLKPGDHDLRVVYAQTVGASLLKVQWQPPGKGQLEDIPGAVLFFRPSAVDKYLRE